jgi:iron complex transport system ATP-binding protein
VSLAVDRLEFAYGTQPVLEGISAQAAHGRLTALIGPNASGKSTLLRCMVGSLRPRAGAVLLDGEPAHRIAPRRLAGRVAYVPQRSIVSAAFTVRQVVELGRYALPPSRTRVEEALERMDLLDVAARPFPELSVGQQQRVTLARALAQVAPDGHLLLDEPTSAMDLRHVRESLRLLRQLAGAGATVVMAVHDLAVAATVADEAWLLAGGRLVASGDVGSVMELERLGEVFGVSFEWVRRTEGRRILHTDI